MADPGDSRQKLAFNTDRRVATLSAHAAALVEGFATYVWSTDPGMSQHEFLDRGLAEVTEDQHRREEIAERERAEQRAVEARRLQAEQEEFRIEREQAERYREWGITSLALPPLGCGNGGLEWSDVWPLIDRYLGELPIEIEVWVPDGEEADDLAPSDEPQLDLFSDGRGREVI